MNPELIILFLAAVPLGIYAIIFGGTLFLSVPLFQILFPEAVVGSIVGNIKVGSLFRNGMALLGSGIKIDYAKMLRIAIPVALGTVIGSLGIVSLPQSFILPILILAIIVIEFAKKITKYINETWYIIISFLTGMYIGILGAGALVLILALLRFKVPENKDIAELRIEGVFVEFVLAIISVSVFLFSGNIDLMIAGVWTAGSLIGGFLGGKLVNRTAKLSPTMQRNLLRATFIFALGIAVWRLI